MVEVNTGRPGFTLRRDQNGLRIVFMLGNEQGYCSYQCEFCNVKRSPKISAEENIRLFDKQYARYRYLIDGPYHPLVYNKGNVTNPSEFSRATLDYVLESFTHDARIQFVSINSREGSATTEVLEYLASRNFKFPIHFILGLESFSATTKEILGKDTMGELQRFIDKLRPYNQRDNQSSSYTFGLDVNLLFLPELYSESKDLGKDDCPGTEKGLQNDLDNILKQADPSVPIEINIHPFCCLDFLPFQNAELETLIRTLPGLQAMVDRHNKQRLATRPVHIFVGIEGKGYNSELWLAQIQQWGSTIDHFNQTGKIIIEGV